MVKVESLITINDIEASHIDDDEKEMRQMGEAFDQHSKSPIMSGLIHMNLAIYEWLVLIQNLFNYDDMKPMKSLSSPLHDEDIKYPVLETLKCLTDDQAVRLDATEGVKVNDKIQKPVLKFIPVHGRPPSLLGSIPSAIKDAEPLVSASRGTLIASTSWSSALLLVLMLISLRMLMLIDVTTARVLKKVDIEKERFWKPLSLPYRIGMLLVENERNLRYTASDRRLKLAQESNSCRQLSLKLFNGYLVKEDIASGGYSVVLIILNVPILLVEFYMCLNSGYL